MRNSGIAHSHENTASAAATRSPTLFFDRGCPSGTRFARPGRGSTASEPCLSKRNLFNHAAGSPDLGHRIQT
jgi:hypothetical protein